MPGKFIDEDMSKALLSPWTWSIVSSLFPPDHKSVASRRHQEWSRQHRDRHPHREVLIGLAGTCLYGFRGALYPCNPGTVFLFDSFEEHDNNYAPTTGRVRHLWLHLVQDDIVYNLYDVRAGRISTGHSVNGRLSAPAVESVLRQCWTDLSAAPVLPVTARRMKIVAALMNVVVRVLEVDAAPTDPGSDRQSQGLLIQSIQRHIQQTAGKGLSLDSLARIAGYSKFHFLRLFRKHTGRSVHDYINVCRLQKVAELRTQGYIKKQIADALGFSCLAAYSRWHREHGS